MVKKSAIMSLRFQRLMNSEGILCSEIQLFKTGKFKHWSGTEFDVNQEFMETMVNNFEAMRETSKDQKDVLPLDYNHGSLEFDPDESKAAGWISELIIREDGLYAEVDFTAKAKQYIKDKEFKYISPEFAVEWTDEHGEKVEGPVLFAAALTNRPFLKGMASIPPLAANQKQHGGNPMKEKLTKLFSLDANVDEDKIVSAAEKSRLALTEVEKSLGCNEGEAVEAIAKLVNDRDQLKANLDKTSEKLLTLQGKTRKDEAARKIAKAKEEGKIVPAKEAEWLKLAEDQPEVFDRLVATLEPVVDMNSKGSQAKNAENIGDLHEEAMKLAQEKKMEYVEALNELSRTKPELVKAHINKSGEHAHLS